MLFLGFVYSMRLIWFLSEFELVMICRVFFGMLSMVIFFFSLEWFWNFDIDMNFFLCFCFLFGCRLRIIFI